VTAASVAQEEERQLAVAIARQSRPSEQRGPLRDAWVLKDERLETGGGPAKWRSGSPPFMVALGVYWTGPKGYRRAPDAWAQRATSRMIWLELVGNRAAHCKAKWNEAQAYLPCGECLRPGTRRRTMPSALFGNVHTEEAIWECRQAIASIQNLQGPTRTSALPWHDKGRWTRP